MAEVTTASALAGLILLTLGATGRLRSISREFPTRGRLLCGLFCLWAVTYAAVGMPVVLAGTRPEMSIENISFVSLFTGHAILTAFLLVWWRLRRPVRLRRFLFLSGATFDDLRGGLALGLRVWGITVAVAVVAGLIIQLALGDADPATSSAIEMPQLPDIMIWLVELPVSRKLLIVLAAMTVEEAFFRAFLQSRIGLLPSSILFAVAHASYGLPTLMIGVFVVSLVIGRDFAKHRQLLRSILAHGVFDAIQLLFIVPFAVRQLQQLQAAP